ncbi:MAG: choice-of-anchor tandem repeat GloVer-containing protein [Candidatus Korobacteraceae bacterium]
MALPCSVARTTAGTVFKMSPHGSSWIVSPLYSFTEGADGGEPQARVVFGPDGSLYGTTSEETTGCGTVYNLRPAATRQNSALANWTVKTLYTIPGLPEGCLPAGDDVIFDQSGNL